MKITHILKIQELYQSKADNAQLSFYNVSKYKASILRKSECKLMWKRFRNLSVFYWAVGIVQYLEFLFYSIFRRAENIFINYFPGVDCCILTSNFKWVISYFNRNIIQLGFRIILTLCLHTILLLPIPTYMSCTNPKTLLTYISKYIWSISTFFFDQKKKSQKYNGVR